MTKRLKSLLHFLPNIIQEVGNTDIEITSIVDDSRKVTPGSLFVAIPGLNTDAHNFIPKAIESGAVVVVGEKKMENVNFSYIQVSNSREALSYLASAWFDNPSRKMKMIGVTGTDGKTTTATLIYEILKGAGKKVGLISTVSAKIENEEVDTGFHVTNPEALELQKFLAIMVEKDCRYTVLEVTSHATDQKRIAGINFEVSVLTNITHEHLDYHKTYENYLKTKAELFKVSKISVLNENDTSFETVKKLVEDKTQIVGYEINSLIGTVKDAVWERFPEEYNRSNAIAAITVSKQLGIEDKSIVQSIKSFPGVTGRMQEIKNNKQMKIIVDFAHTPNALENVLIALRKQTEGRLIVVFGCASERDDTKRPMMGKIATDLADVSVFTAEDPRKEDVNKILNEIASGVKSADELKPEESLKSNKHYFIKIPERGEAIYLAINKIAKEGDTVVITGKGHEKSMAYNGVEHPWSDQEAVQMSLEGKIKEIKR